MRHFGALAVALAALVLAPLAAASEALADKSVRGLKLAVNGKGEALVTYRRTDGRARKVLVWGGLNARAPSAEHPQVRFSFDYAGGWRKYRRAYWKSFRNACRRYEGPALPYLVTACTAPDGSHWAVQTWQRGLPLLGFNPWLPSQTAWEFHLSHWKGELPRFEVHVNWTYGGSAVGVFGRLTYLGQPVHGFASTARGNPKERYSRNVYIDTFNSPYGPGWKRESGILTHRPTGTFCHSFVPQKPFSHYPKTGEQFRPAARGDRNRATVMGPGVTPVVVWEAAGLGQYDANQDAEINQIFDAVMAGDRICAGER